MTSDGSDPDGQGGKNNLHVRVDGQTTIDEVPADLVEISGTIKWFDVAKGYGFIVPDGGGADVLLHVTSLRRDGFQ
ncbi:cold-shock protein, partial [Escherichia coli]|uniref:cold-shock protein n=1 Tax=Escherichia coli TaxID=562 RepID=UPI0013CFCBF6